jgi:hypothetical protein
MGGTCSMYGETRSAHKIVAGELYSPLLTALKIRAYKTASVLHRYVTCLLH